MLEYEIKTLICVVRKKYNTQNVPNQSPLTKTIQHITDYITIINRKQAIQIILYVDGYTDEIILFVNRWTGWSTLKPIIYSASYIPNQQIQQNGWKKYRKLLKTQKDV